MNKEDNTKRIIIYKRIMLGLVLLAIIGIGVLIGYYFKNASKDSKDIITKENIESVIDDGWKTPNGTNGKVKLYESVNSKSLLIASNTDNDSFLEDKEYYRAKYTYKCNNSDCSGKRVYEYLNYAVIKDGDFVLYDYVNNKYKTIDVKEEKFSNLELLYYNGKIYGYALINEENHAAIYNLKKEKLVTDYVYTNAFYNENPELVDDNLICMDDNNQYLINFNTGKEKMSFPNSEPFDDNYFMISAAGNGKNIYYLKNHGFESIDVEVCNENFENILDNRRFSNYGVLKNGNIIVKTSDDEFSEFTKKGVLVKESEKYKSVVTIGNEYVGVIDTDDYLKVVNYQGKELARFTKITDKHVIHDLLSGWYKTANKEGLYIVVEDESINVGILGRGTEYYYVPEKDKSGKIELTEIGGYAKPVLYLYPKSDNTFIKITFENKNIISTTYPKYNDSWEVYADKNGNLKDKNNNKYYALYWDEKTHKNVSFESGFYVTKENAIDFLEEKLNYIGLNYKEKNEFIMYWLPVLEKNEKSLVYFEFTNSREKFNKLNITPKPDSILRLAIHIKKVDRKIDIKEQKLYKFDRKGFTAVEWGGVTY